MVKRYVFVLFTTLLFNLPAAAQDFAQLELGFGYGNYGIEVRNSPLDPLETDRVSGFAVHTNYNLTGWFGIDNYTAAYSVPFDATLYASLFGVKLTARDVVDGRISPYVVAGFGFGSFTSNRTGGGFSTSAARYGGGVDLNMSEALAFRIEATGLALSSGLSDPSWTSSLNLTTGVVFKLGF